MDDRDDSVLIGTVTRKVLCTLIKHKAFGPAHSNPHSAKRVSPLVNWGTLEIIYPNYPEIQDLKLSPDER